MGNVSKVKLPDGNTYDIKDEISGYLTTETDPTVPEWAKAASKPSYTPEEIGALPDDTFIPTKTSDLVNDSDFMSGMTILSYGSSTWQDFITAYTKKHVVYCRASSNSNPATGSQTRLAFMAYVNNTNSPTEVEFQYYRSVSTHTASQQGDQVYVYKLTSAGKWTVTVREASVKVAAGTGITGTYSSGTMTLALNGTLPTKTSDLTNDSGFITGSDVPTNETDPTVPSWAKASTKPSYTASEVGALPSTTVIPSATSDLTNDSGFITLSDVPTEVLNTEFIPSSTPITSWISGNWQISVMGNIGLPARIEFEKITTGNHLEYSGHRFPISIPAVGAGLSKTFDVQLMNGQVGVQLKDSANNNLLAIYSTDQYHYQSISSSVMASTAAINILVTGDTNNTIPVGTRCYIDGILIANTSTGDHLWEFTYDDAVEANDGSSSVPFTDLKQALTAGKVLQLYDNGLCYSYLGDTNDTIIFGRIDEDVYKQYIVTSDNSISVQETSLQTTNNLVTTIDSSSTDSEYPSAKCVYDIVGNIESLLASI